MGWHAALLQSGRAPQGPHLAQSAPGWSQSGPDNMVCQVGRGEGMEAYGSPLGMGPRPSLGAGGAHLARSAPGLVSIMGTSMMVRPS